MGITFRCLIVDDERPAHLVIRSHIAHCEELEYSGSAYNGKEAIKLLSENNYDLMFLDIDMPLVNGMEVLQTMPRRPVTIITSAYNNFAFDAYQLDVIDYLQKPIAFTRFLKSVEKAKVYRLSEVKNKFQKWCITIRVNGEVKELQLEDILYFQSVGNYVKVYFKYKNKPLVIYEALKNIIANQRTNNPLVQTHKSYIVNSDYMISVDKERVLLTGEIAIPLGRKYELSVNRLFEQKQDT